MVFLRLKTQVRKFFAPYLDIVEGNILFPYTLKNQVVENERWSENSVRDPVTQGIWLAANSLPLSVTDLFIGHSARDIICFCHFYTNWIIPHCPCAFASLGLLPTKGQFTGLKTVFTNAKIHTVFDGGLSGRVADCKVASWQIGMSAMFSIVDENVEFFCKKKRYIIPIENFSLNCFEKMSGIRANIRTHKPKAHFETFYQSFAKGVLSK